MSAVPSASAGSNTWTRLSGAGKSVGGLAVAPSDPNILLARTPKGLLRSTDRGRTWRLAGKRLGTHHETYFGLYGPGGVGDSWGWTVWIDPLDPRIVYSTVGEPYLDSWADITPTSIYRSSDGGSTWRQVLADDGGQVAIYPGDPRIVYVAGQLGIWKSADRGLTWSQVYYLGARSLAVAANDPNRVLAIAGDCLAKSIDGGLTWNSLPTPNDLPYYPLRFQEIVGWSPDGDVTWSLDGGYPNPLDPSERFTVANRDGDTPGIVRSADGGRSRSLLPLPTTGEIWALVADRGSPQTLYAAAEDGLWAYTFGVAPVDAGALPKTGSPDSTALPIVVVLAGALALSLVGLLLRRWADSGPAAPALETSSDRGRHPNSGSSAG